MPRKAFKAKTKKQDKGEYSPLISELSDIFGESEEWTSETFGGLID